jgi:hypothetical protein
VAAGSEAAAELDAVVEAARGLPTPWPQWPGGWPGEAEAALIDAVFGIRARYGSPESGVRAVVSRWRAHRGGRLDDLSVLASTPADQVAAVLANRSKASGRPKSELVRAAAQALVSAGVRQADDAVRDVGRAHDAYTGVHGLGGVTSTYFLMLLGVPGVKADTWVRRFVPQAVGRPVSADEAASLLQRAARVMGTDAIELDYAVWAHIRRPRR